MRGSKFETSGGTRGGVYTRLSSIPLKSWGAVVVGGPLINFLLLGVGC